MVTTDPLVLTVTVQQATLNWIKPVSIYFAHKSAICPGLKKDNLYLLHVASPRAAWQEAGETTFNTVYLQGWQVSAGCQLVAEPVP